MTLAPERASLPSAEAANPAVSLSCRHCGATYPLSPTHVCIECFAPLEIAYDEDRLRTVTRESIEAGPRNLWRYVGLLPAGHVAERRVSLDAGWTPLRPAPRLAAALGMRTLWVKDDSANPTHSFKDRVVSVALTAARELGFTTVACASTGNLAQSVAAHAASAGLRSVVLVPHDLEAGKTVSTAVYGGALVAIKGNYDDVNRLCSELAGEYEWAFVNVNVRPFYAEGSKTLGYEVAEQLGWRLPGQVVIPIASGSLLTKVDKAFGELGRLGLVEPTPYKVFGAQAAGCNPVASAFARGVDTVAPVKPSTIAKSLSIGNPADGPYALDVARRTGGAITDVTDEQIVDGIRLLARTEGIFGETAGGVTVACLRRLLDEGRLDPDVETVIYNTGDGLKTLDPLVSTGGPTATIPPSLSAFEAAGLGDD
ncbi:threonine synthase [Parafrankia colletiae]|uniref:Threonine synthase n=1 Tax=Parafrankia colletiae TaxID=573497 RepID=A0A1S1Q343_9ACTN|nr:threonine synthase [Parafrankia colletiae]MCK9898937.1 threonine synthase [Frankia sp. Cpl3]OHV29318.1 threonine synthase [Parafrankia colletiae]